MILTTTRWFAIPSRTALASLWWVKNARSSVDSASVSSTSPSLTMPGRRGAIAVRLTAREPLALTSVAAMLPVSISRPTTVWGFLFLVSTGDPSWGWRLSHTPSATGAPLPIPKSDEPCGQARGALAHEVVQIGLDHLATRKEGDHATDRQKRAKRDRVLAGLGPA